MNVSFNQWRTKIKSQSDGPEEDVESRFGRNRSLNKDDYYVRLSDAKRMLNESNPVGEPDEQVKHMMLTIDNQNQMINQHIQRITELENYIKQLTNITQQHETKIVEHNNFVNKYSTTLQFNKKELDDRQEFVIDVLEKYSDYTNNHSDGFQASTLGILVELESDCEISKGQVKGIMKTIEPTRERGPGSCKQEKMFGGCLHYRGFKPKDIVANLGNDRESLSRIVGHQSSIQQDNITHTSRNTIVQNVSLPQITGQMSPTYNGATSPAPIMLQH